ncbi:MAG: MFS transporter [Alphaproteobacteria bacterium]|nr:MAG: MFS transporter [Alphaproteobacteria bacterium]
MGPHPDRGARGAEFIALVAMLFATVAFSIDSMLPAMPEIAAELTPAAPNRAQLVVTSFVFGLGVGTLFAGPISDAIGRRKVIVGGAAIYALGAVLAARAGSLEALLAARVLQGLGASGPRVASLALVRDRHAGARMARIVSFAMTVFALVPAVAPAIGALILAAFGWRAIFGAFVVFAALSSAWLLLRQPETLAPEARRPLRPARILAAVGEVLSHGVVLRAILAQVFIFGSLMAVLSSTQMVFDKTFGLGDSFPFWFAMIVLVAGTGSFANARLVLRLGMIRLVTTTLTVEFLFSATVAALWGTGLLPEPLRFPLYFAWTTSVFFMLGFTMGNLNALALEPMGHIAGTAASVISALATALAVVIAIPVGLAFDGTPLPLFLGVAASLACARLSVRGLVPAVAGP